jgi:peroxin-14
MATVVSGVGYGLYSLGKRYVYPLIAPPTPERLEQDKKAIDEQFDKAFVLFDQLSKDTEALKAAEQDRTQRLDNALSDLENVITELKSANNRREDEAHRIRTDVQALKESIPKALNAQKDLTDGRLRELTTELGSLKTLMSQRANASSIPPSTAIGAPAAPANTSPASSPHHNETMRQMRNSIAHTGMFLPPRSTTAASESGMDDNPPSIGFGGLSRAATFNNSLPGSGLPSSGLPSGSLPGGSLPGSTKASIPSWQLAMATKSASSSALNGAEAGVTSSSQSVTGGS